MIVMLLLEHVDERSGNCGPAAQHVVLHTSEYVRADATAMSSYKHKSGGCVRSYPRRFWAFKAKKSKLEWVSCHRTASHCTLTPPCPLPIQGMNGIDEKCSEKLKSLTIVLLVTKLPSAVTRSGLMSRSCHVCLRPRQSSPPCELLPSPPGDAELRAKWWAMEQCVQPRRIVCAQ